MPISEDVFHIPIHEMMVHVFRDGNGSYGSIESSLKDGSTDVEWIAACNAIESMVLAHACAGIAILDPAYLEGLETAIQSCAQNI